MTWSMDQKFFFNYQVLLISLPWNLRKQSQTFQIQVSKPLEKRDTRNQQEVKKWNHFPMFSKIQVWAFLVINMSEMDKLRAVQLLDNIVLTTLIELPFCYHQHHPLFNGLLVPNTQKSKGRTKSCINPDVSIVSLCHIYLEQMTGVNPLFN